MRQMITLIRREIIEHRAGWAVPAVFGALFVLAALLAVFGVARFGTPEGATTLLELAEEKDVAAFAVGMQVMLVSIAMILNLVMAFVVLFYFLDALYAERKDRSILFWKSLPVSDLQVVGSKYLTGVVAIPLMTVLIFVATALLIYLIGGAWLLWHGAGGLMAGAPGALARSTLLLCYTLVFQALWFAPLDGWLLLVSAFAKRAVLGWAVLPPVLLVVAEKTLLGSRHFLDMVAHRMAGGFDLAFNFGSGHAMVEIDGGAVAAFPAITELVTPARALAAPSLWAGIVIGVLLLAGAVWLRRWRDES
jgi:ABC-2 type transport system permease protein